MENLEGFQNSIRLNLLLNEATHILQQAFRDGYKSVTGKDWTDGSASGQDFIDTIGKKYFSSAQKIQKNLLKAGNVNQWDLSMLCTILTSTTTSLVINNRCEKGKSKILELRDIRNKLAHLGDLKSSPFVSPQEFSDLWNKLSGIVISLGGSAFAATVEKIKSSSNISGIEFKNVEGALCSENQEKVQELKNQGNSAVGSGEWEKAIGFYTRALNLFGISDVDRSILYSNRSHVYLKTLKQNQSLRQSCDKEIEEKSNDALDDARKCVELRPNWWKGYARLGQVFQWRKEWNTAIKCYDQSLMLSPNQKEVLDSRVECLYDSKSEEIQQNLDPLNYSASRDEILERNRRTKDCEVKADDITKINQELMKSRDPKLRAKACVYFAHNYYHGIDAPLDIAKAAQFFARGAELGDAEGIYNLGLLHLKGEGVPRDFQKAMQLFEKAAGKPQIDPCTGMQDIGVSSAEFAIGKAYENGTGKPKDFKMAAKWYLRSSGHGVSNADNNLGLMYQDGRGVERDMNKALLFWELGASRNNTLAMNSLAYGYLDRGDVKKAQMWFQRSIDGGNMHSILNKQQFDEAVAKVERGQVIPSMSDFLSQFSQSMPMALQRDVAKTIEMASRSESKSKSKSASNSDDKSTKNQFRSTDLDCSNIRHEHQLTNPNRLQLVKTFRHGIKTDIEASLETGQSTIYSSATALRKQKAPVKLSSLKDITIGEMDPNKDHVHTGTVINLTIVEDPIMTHYPSVHTLVRDENWDVIMCYFYNFDREEERREKFKFGTQLSITNPYHRLTADRSHAIRVDDPKSVMFQGRDENLCRFCWKEMKESEQSRCAKCKRVIYCGKDCQVQDWKLLSHKAVCDPQLLQKL